MNLLENVYFEICRSDDLTIFPYLSKLYYHHCLENSTYLSLLDIFFFFFSFFLQLHLWHIEVPRLGVKLELQLLTYTTAIATPDLTASTTSIKACGNAGSLTH